MSTEKASRMFVTGATGELGRLVVFDLAARIGPDRVVAGVRNLDHSVAIQFRSQGIKTRVADYDRPDTLRAAFEGIDRVLLISSVPGPDRVTQHRSVIETAKEAGVGLLAYTSLLHAETSTAMVGDDHRSTEADLKASGLAYVLIRHGWYTENHVPSVAPALRYGAVIGNAGAGRFSSAPRSDYAAADALILTLDGQAGKIHELAGDESYSLTELAKTITATSGTKVSYQDMPKDGFRIALEKMDLPRHVADIVAESDVGASRGELEDHSRHMSALLGRPTTPYSRIIDVAVSGIIGSKMIS